MFPHAGMGSQPTMAELKKRRRVSTITIAGTVPRLIFRVASGRAWEMRQLQQNRYARVETRARRPQNPMQRLRPVLRKSGEKASIGSEFPRLKPEDMA